MKSYNRFHRSFLCFMLALAITLAGSPVRAQSLYEMFKEASNGGRFVMPTHGELAEAQLMFELLLTGKKDTKAFAELLDSLHLETVNVANKISSLTIVREKEGWKTGRGFYIVNELTDRPRYLMIPHAYTDIHTGRIAIKLTKLGGFAITALNTEKRYVTENGITLNQDLAHLTGTYFTALSRAMAKLTTRPEILQLHGFSQTNRNSEEARQADVIVSSGQRVLRSAARQMADCLIEGIPYITRTYPDDVKELGGVTNITGKILRKAGHKGFIHVELSRPLRDKLNKDSKLLQEFNKCLIGRP